MLEELRGVLGITPELYRRLEDWFTLYTGQNGLNPAKASGEILLPLLGGDRGLVETYLAQRREGAPPPLPPVPDLNFHSAGDMVYSVVAVAEFPEQSGAGLRAVVKRGRGTDGSPFTYLGWKPRMRAIKPARGGPPNEEETSLFDPNAEPQ